MWLPHSRWCALLHLWEKLIKPTILCLSRGKKDEDEYWASKPCPFLSPQHRGRGGQRRIFISSMLYSTPFSNELHHTLKKKSIIKNSVFILSSIIVVFIPNDAQKVFWIINLCCQTLMRLWCACYKSSKSCELKVWGERKKSQKRERRDCGLINQVKSE